MSPAQRLRYGLGYELREKLPTVGVSLGTYATLAGLRPHQPGRWIRRCDLVHSRVELLWTHSKQTGMLRPVRIAAQSSARPDGLTHPEPALGSIIVGRYRIDAILGRGGSGTVFAAHDERLAPRVALKLLQQASPDATARMLREARVCARLQSDHIVQLFDVGCIVQLFDVGCLEDGSPFLVMQLLVGEDLSSVVTRGPLEIPTAVQYVLQTCSAIEVAHDAGILHRDLKPANLFVAKTSTGASCIKVLDFGISKSLGIPTLNSLTATVSGEVLGTPAYMSPEQFYGDRALDVRTDVWGLGVVLFELLTGSRPFVGDSIAALAIAIATMEARDLNSFRPDVPPALATVVRRCLAKSPGQRFASVRALAEALSASNEVEPRPKDSSVVYAQSKTLASSAERAAGDVLPGQPSAMRARAPTECSLPTIAAGCFEILCGDAPAPDFCARLHAEIVHRLAEEWPAVLARDAALNMSALRLPVASGGARSSAMLGADLVLGGVLSLHANRLLLVASLIRSSDAQQVWSRRFEIDADHVAGPAELAAQVTREFGVELYHREGRRVGAISPLELDAQALELKSVWHLHRATPEDCRLARACAYRAMQRDPQLASLGYVVALSLQLDLLQWSVAQSDAVPDLARAAEELARAYPSEFFTHVAAAHAWAAQGSHSQAIDHLEAALERDPCSPRAHALYGELLAFSGRAHQGLEYVGAATRASLHHPAAWSLELSAALTHFAAENYVDAAFWAKRALVSCPQIPLTRATLATALALTGDVHGARSAAAALNVYGTRPLHTAVQHSLRNAARPLRIRFMEGMRKACC